MEQIAASTKDDMLVVLVPPDPTHCTLSFSVSCILINRPLASPLADNLKIYLKDVGTKLVANLSLLSEFSKVVAEVADWWSLVKDDLALEESKLLAVTYPQYEGWSEMKDDFQEYYDVVRLPVIAMTYTMILQTF